MNPTVLSCYQDGNSRVSATACAGLAEEPLELLAVEAVPWDGARAVQPQGQVPLRAHGGCLAAAAQLHLAGCVASSWSELQVEQCRSDRTQGE